MTGPLARYVLAPLHERLLGRPTFSCMMELEHTQWASPDELRCLQTRKLQKLLHHALKNTEFYRARIEGHATANARRDPFDTLSQMPTLNKVEIRRSIAQMLWHDAPGGLHERHTGGSTGEPLKFYMDRRRQAYDQAARARSHRWFDVAVGAREAFIWGSPIEFRAADVARRIRDRAFNHFLFDAFDMSPERMTAFWHRLRRLRPHCLFGYPSSLALFARHAESEGLPPLPGPLRAVFVTGEVCLPGDRAIIERVFDVPVADGYGSREAGFIAHQCRESNMHITAENVVVEILDGDKPVPCGQAGEIVTTHLDAYAMPLIRYRTGDVGRLLPGRCACGRGLPLMSVVEGRSTDFLTMPDGTTMHGLSVIYPLRELPGVDRFRVTQGVDLSLHVEVTPVAHSVGVTRNEVSHALESVVRGRVPIDVRLVPRIEASPSGKFRYVVSHAHGTQQDYSRN